VFGCTSPKVREKLINAGDKLTLDKAIQTVQNFEYCQKQLSSMAVGDSNAVDAVKQTSSRSRRQTKRSTGHTDRYRTEDARVRTDKPNKCGNCGTVHDKFRCPATGKRCRKCNKLNHFQVMCRSRSSKYVHDVVEKDSDSDQDTYAYNIDMVSDSISSSHSKNRDPLFVTLHVGPKKSKIKFKIDTGSSVNIIPISIFRSIGLKHPMQAPDCKLIAYSGNMLNTLGVVNLDCCHRTVVRPTKFYIVDTNAPPLIGTQSSLDLGLIKLTYAVDAPSSEEAVFTKETVMKVYGDVFKGVGVLPGKCHLHLKEGAIPTVNPPRRIPEALKSKLKKELDQMVKDKIIRRVTEPTDWVNSIVVVEKPNTGKLRICLDPKALNEAIRRPHFKTPTLEDVTAQLAGAKYFSILDITHAYWSVELDDESSLLTTFHSPTGERYCYLRLPFGISSSGDIFQRKVTEIFEGLPGIQAIVDDTLIYGKTRAEHDQNLRNALNRAREKGVRFNPDKCVIGVTEVPFFGHVISDTGLKPDTSKIEAVLQIPAPDCRAKLETFLGLVNYLGKFTQNLSEVTHPLRSLLQKDTEFVWDEPQNRAFELVKKIITETPVLRYFDPQKQLVLETDASKHGLGCCIMQDGQPIAFASKSLTKSEIHYTQIEKELLAILFGCKKFHQYTYGRKVVCLCDHKPIAAIMKKPLSAAPPRLQRMLLQLQRYDVEVRHVSGKQIPVSDCLSRQFLDQTYPTLMEGLDLHVHAVQQQLYVNDRRLDSIRSHIESDP